MIKIFEYMIYYLDDSPQIKFTDLMDKLIEWDPKIRSLAKIDTVNSILKKWSNKFSGRLAIQSIRRLINEFMLIHLEFKTTGSKNVLTFWKRYDYLIEMLIMIFKQDLDEVEAIMSAYINDKAVRASEFWVYLNSTFEDAQKYKRSWALTLSNNTAINKLYELRKTPIHIWVAENCKDFDMTEYLKLSKENKDNNQFNAKLRVLAQTVNSGFRSQQSTPRMDGFKQGGFKRSSGGRSESPAKKLFNWLLPTYKKVAGAVNWPEAYCGFYQSKEGCKSDKCKRAHKCPICDGEHKLDACPEGKNK